MGKRKPVHFHWLLMIGLAALAALLAGCTGAGEVSPTADPLMTTLTVLAPEEDPTAASDVEAIATLLVPQTAPSSPAGVMDPTPPPGVAATAPAATAAALPEATAAVTQPAESTIPATECSAPAELTPPMTEGPYYSPGAPETTNLYEEGMVGQRLLLTGYVLNANCEPVPGARVDFWQADGQGVYDNAGYRLRGQQVSAADGSYRLETVIPGEYPGRTPHIHVKVQAPGGPEITTQLFFPGMGANESDRIFDARLIVREMEPDPANPDVARAAFDFIIAE